MFDGTSGIGSVVVATSNNGGFPVEHWAERCASKIIHVAESSHPEIKKQALDAQAAIQKSIQYYMQLAVNSDRKTILYTLRDFGAAAAADELEQILKDLSGDIP